MGLIPINALLTSGRYYLEKQQRSLGVSEKEILECAVQSLGLNDVSNFRLNEKIIELAINNSDNSLMDLQTNDLISVIAENSPAPGGGSVSALAGSVGSALLSMVALLTYEKKDFLSKRKKMSDFGERSQRYQKRLIELVDEDTLAFQGVISASRLPQNSNNEIEIKKKALFNANKIATDTPFEIASISLQVLRLSIEMIKHGNPNSVTDAHVAAEVCHAGVRGGCTNVMINLPNFEDVSDYDPEIKIKIQEMLDESSRLHKRAFQLTNKIISRQN